MLRPVLKNIVLAKRVESDIGNSCAQFIKDL